MALTLLVQTRYVPEHLQTTVVQKTSSLSMQGSISGVLALDMQQLSANAIVTALILGISTRESLSSTKRKML